MNIVETFNNFNGGMRRPNRREHMRHCDFVLSMLLEDYDDKPMVEVKNYLDKLSEEIGGNYHAVTLPYKNSHGWTYYEVWRKTITQK
tara:strand:+ start:554 stop:814 length:261 start_codon:yes stop_codon:yes gene_type:complete